MHVNTKMVSNVSSKQTMASDLCLPFWIICRDEDSNLFKDTIYLNDSRNYEVWVESSDKWGYTNIKGIQSKP